VGRQGKDGFDLDSAGQVSLGHQPGLVGSFDLKVGEEDVANHVGRDVLSSFLVKDEAAHVPATSVGVPS